MGPLAVLTTQAAAQGLWGAVKGFIGGVIKKTLKAKMELNVKVYGAPNTPRKTLQLVAATVLFQRLSVLQKQWQGYAIKYTHNLMERMVELSYVGYSGVIGGAAIMLQKNGVLIGNAGVDWGTDSIPNVTTDQEPGRTTPVDLTLENNSRTNTYLTNLVVNALVDGSSQPPTPS